MSAVTGKITKLSMVVTNERIRMVMMLVTLALFILGAGAPETASSGGGA